MTDDAARLWAEIQRIAGTGRDERPGPNYGDAVTLFGTWHTPDHPRAARAIRELVAAGYITHTNNGALHVQ